MGIRCADHVTLLYPQKLALTSPTGGGRSVGIVRSRTKATEFFFYVLKVIASIVQSAISLEFVLVRDIKKRCNIAICFKCVFL